MSVALLIVLAGLVVVQCAGLYYQFKHYQAVKRRRGL